MNALGRRKRNKEEELSDFSPPTTFPGRQFEESFSLNFWHGRARGREGGRRFGGGSRREARWGGRGEERERGGGGGGAIGRRRREKPLSPPSLLIDYAQVVERAREDRKEEEGGSSEKNPIHHSRSPPPPTFEGRGGPLSFSARGSPYRPNPERRVGRKPLSALNWV